MGRSIAHCSLPANAEPPRRSGIHALPLLCLMALAIMPTHAVRAAAETPSTDPVRPAFNFGLGIESSGEYRKQLEAAYGNVSGISAWVIMHAGFEIPVVPRVSVVPDVRWMFSRISYESAFGIPAAEKFNSLFCGRVGARIRPTGRTTGPYLQGSIGAFGASSDLSRLEFTAKNPALGVGVGVTVGEYELELLFDRLEVETRFTGGAPSPAGAGTAESFSGIGVMVMRRLSF